MASKAPQHEFRILRIRLKDVEPTVERRVMVDADLTLFDLYQVLVNAIGWNDSHLHSFSVGDDIYSAPVPDIEPVGIDERTIAVSDALPKVGSEIGWDYDFGDGWEHEVTVIAAGKSDRPTPSIVIEGSRACPPDDCGGPHGYSEIVKILEDPAYESDFVDSDQIRAWLPGDFDPNEFDRAEAQARVDLLPSLEGWNEMFAANPDVAKHWTKKEMDKQRIEMEKWQKKMSEELGFDDLPDA